MASVSVSRIAILQWRCARNKRGLKSTKDRQVDAMEIEFAGKESQARIRGGKVSTRRQIVYANPSTGQRLQKPRPRGPIPESPANAAGIPELRSNHQPKFKKKRKKGVA